MEGSTPECDLAADEGGVAVGGPDVQMKRAVFVQNKAP